MCCVLIVALLVNCSQYLLPCSDLASRPMTSGDMSACLVDYSVQPVSGQASGSGNFRIAVREHCNLLGPPTADYEVAKLPKGRRIRPPSAIPAPLPLVLS